MKIIVIANCQGQVIERLLLANGQLDVQRHVIHTVDEDVITEAYLRDFDLVIAQDLRKDRAAIWQAIEQHPRVVRFPWQIFFGFTPDHSTTHKPALDNISRIMSAAWHFGFDRDKIVALFNPEFLDAMGYYRDFANHRSAFVGMMARYTDKAEYLFEKWFDQGVFFYTGNHAKSFVIEDTLIEVLKRQGVDLGLRPVSAYIPDPLQVHGCMPNLNHPKATNLLSSRDQVYKFGDRVFSLGQMVARTFRQLEPSEGRVEVSSANLATFEAAYKAYSGRQPEPMSNPYAKRPAYNFWSRAVARPAQDKVRPGDDIVPVIGPQTRVATAGSCFAQHVARAMVANGLNYYVAEQAPLGLDPDIAQAQGYGLFSARYGNIYSTRQLLQLIRRAYGRFVPLETAWVADEGFIDPFRPNIGETFDSIEAVEAARRGHLAHVRKMFETLDVFVFTLGLTEGWVDRRDGAAYPVTPGSVTKDADPAHFEFCNLDYSQVKDDLISFLGELFEVNKAAKVILTVSPVPLIASYTDSDALSATTYSKSVLRAVAGDVAHSFDAVQYFPSYEIITGAFNKGAYFEEDLRGIKAEGVAHVMRVFLSRLVGDPAETAKDAVQDVADGVAVLTDELKRQSFVVCDEELQVRGI